MANKKKADETGSLIARNRRARHDYEILDRYEAGIALTGTEVKSLREGHASIAQAFIDLDKDGEVWLDDANIPEYLDGTWTNHAPKRRRKLLLHKKQIARLMRGSDAKGFTIIPLSLYFNEDGRAKVEIALARGKKEVDTRAALTADEATREMQRARRARNLRDWGSTRAF